MSNSTASEIVRRRWFSYSLRTLFVVLTVFCIWLGVQVKWIKDRHEAMKWVEAINRRPDPVTKRASDEVFYFDPRSAPWQIRILGELGVPEVPIKLSRIRESDDLDNRLEELKRLFPESVVSAD